MPRQRNSADSTTRNVRASQRRDDLLAKRVARLEATVKAIEARLSDRGESQQPIGSRGRTR